MKKTREWKVIHHHLNPRREELEYFARRADAERAVRAMETKDFDDEQYSEIVNVRTGQHGSRRWGKRKLTWDPDPDPKLISIFPDPRENSEGLQLAFAVGGLPEPEPLQPETIQ
jgi:hypothetical protein